MVKRLLLLLSTLVVAIQFVPYGRDHDNPPVVSEPTWDSTNTRELIVGACFDCHSNETRWPWYSNLAPFSWLIQQDVAEGRDELNFSTWDDDGEVEDIAETILAGSMPPTRYSILHPAARLTEAELDQLLTGLERTFGAQFENEENEEDEDEDD